MNPQLDLDHSTILFIELAKMVANINRYAALIPNLEPARDSFCIALETEFSNLPEKMQDAVRESVGTPWR